MNEPDPRERPAPERAAVPPGGSRRGRAGTGALLDSGADPGRAALRKAREIRPGPARSRAPARRGPRRRPAAPVSPSPPTDMIHARTAALILCLCALPVPSFAADGPAEAPVGDATAGAAKAAVCAGCHGLDGKALQPEYPNIAAQHASYLAKQLTEYRDGERVNAIMNGIAAPLTDEDILNLAAHYAAQPPIPGVANEETLALGESIYRGGITSQGIAACIGCHNPQGLGNPASVVPALSGQNAKYTADQLRYFRDGTRANDPNRVMRALSHRLVDAEIEAVADYVQGLY